MSQDRGGVGDQAGPEWQQAYQLSRLGELFGCCFAAVRRVWPALPHWSPPGAPGRKFAVVRCARIHPRPGGAGDRRRLPHQPRRDNVVGDRAQGRPVVSKNQHGRRDRRCRAAYRCNSPDLRVSRRDHRGRARLSVPALRVGFITEAARLSGAGRYRARDVDSFRGGITNRPNRHIHAARREKDPYRAAD
jgi:hypothetical protein